MAIITYIILHHKYLFYLAWVNTELWKKYEKFQGAFFFYHIYSRRCGEKMAKAFNWQEITIFSTPSSFALSILRELDNWSLFTCRNMVRFQFSEQKTRGTLLKSISSARCPFVVLLRGWMKQKIIRFFHRLQLSNTIMNTAEIVSFMWMWH